MCTIIRNDIKELLNGEYVKLEVSRDGDFVSIYIMDLDNEDKLFDYEWLVPYNDLCVLGWYYYKNLITDLFNNDICGFKFGTMF